MIKDPPEITKNMFKKHVDPVADPEEYSIEHHKTETFRARKRFQKTESTPNDKLSPQRSQIIQNSSPSPNPFPPGKTRPPYYRKDQDNAFAFKNEKLK